MFPWLLQLLPIQVHCTFLGVTYAEIRGEVAGMTPLLGINLITVSHACQDQGREKGLLAIPQGFYAEETGLYSRFQYCRVRLAKRGLV